MRRELTRGPRPLRYPDKGEPSNIHPIVLELSSRHQRTVKFSYVERNLPQFGELSGGVARALHSHTDSVRVVSRKGLLVPQV